MWKVLVYYTGPEQGKVQDKKQWLHFKVAHLTDSFLKTVRIGHGSNWGWEMIPLNNCERIKIILVIVCSGEDLPVSQWMWIGWDWDCNIAMNDLIKEDQSSVGATLLESSPATRVVQRINVTAIYQYSEM